MSSFHNLYASRYFISSFQLPISGFYQRPVDLTLFAKGDIVSVVSHNFSNFKNSLSYNVFFTSANMRLSAVCPFTKVIAPIFYLSSKFKCDFSWFLLYKALPTNSISARAFLPCLRTVFLLFPVLKFTFFHNRYILNNKSNNGNSFPIV